MTIGITDWLSVEEPDAPPSMAQVWRPDGHGGWALYEPSL